MIGANPFKSETIAPMDLLVKYPGWQNTNIHLDYINGERSDVLDAKLPIWISAKKDLYEGDLPIWNHQRGGKPGLTFTNSLLTPAFWTFALFENDALGFYLSNLVNVLIGLLGMFLFLRIFFGQAASLFGAFIFMFSGFNTAWFFWAHVDTTIWTPWVLLSVYKYIDTKEAKYLPFVAVTMLMLNLGGFPMVAVMTYMSIAIMVFTFLIAKKIPFTKSLSILFNLALFSILSVIIALPFIYPLVELLEWMGGIGYRRGGAGFKLQDFNLFINPDFYRYPRVETTFYVGILPLIFLFLSLIFYSLKPRFIGIFGLILFLYSVTIAFTLISPDIIHKIPTLNSSLLTRFGYLIGLSLAIISAYVFNELITKFKQKKWIGIAIILIFTIQIIDQKRLFNRFNAAVPNASFYPQTKTIDYLQKHLQPFQYVMADSGFLISGILGGYGLNDWYAHSFHTKEEKNILNKLVKNPFKTPTSAMFPCSAINFESPYINYLNIKSTLCTSPFDLDNNIALWDNEKNRQPAAIMPTNTLLQKFTIEKEIEIEGIKLLMATYGEKQASSDVKLVLMKDDLIIDSSLVQKEMINDNKWVQFKFEKPINLLVGDYSISIEMLSTANAKALTVWSNTVAGNNTLMVNGKKTNKSLSMLLSQKGPLSERFKVTNLEPNIYLVENLQVSGNAYFLSSLNKSHNIDHSKLKTTILSNTEIQMDYSGKEQGWVILPMRSYPGWIATVNGKEIQTKKFLGMLPAIKVKGKSKIVMTYAPSYNTYTYLLSLLGVFILLFSILKFRKKD